MDKAASAGHSDRCRIVVDTCCDFSPEVAASLDVDILGFPFIIDGEERTDDIWSSMSLRSSTTACAPVPACPPRLCRSVAISSSLPSAPKRARPRSTCALPRRCRRATTPRARRQMPCAPSIPTLSSTWSTTLCLRDRRALGARGRAPAFGGTDRQAAGRLGKRG